MDTEPRDPSNVPTREERPRASGTARGLLIALAIGLVAVFAMQVFTLVSVSRVDEQIDTLDEQIAALDEQINSIGGDVADVQESVDGVDQKVDDLITTSSLAPVASDTPAAVAPSAPGGHLPLFNGEPDAASGIVLGDVTGVEYYTGEEITIDPTDGIARAWLIWAHWCPYCQQELSPLSDWYTENAHLYPNVELVSITSAIDPTKGNPLEPYLDELQLSFPVILDPDLALAEQFGLSAYPFWVFTDRDGETLGRTAGLLGVERVAEIFDRLETQAP